MFPRHGRPVALAVLIVALATLATSLHVDAQASVVAVTGGTVIDGMAALRCRTP
jgi:hypothetical protein